eukprot:scaffold182649_cov41-Attheya_sp.AAC.1
MPPPSRKKCHISPHDVSIEANSNIDRLANMVTPTKAVMATTAATAATEHVRDESNMKNDYDSSFLIDAFNVVCKHVQLRRHWISSHVYADAINKHYGFTTLETKIDAARLNRVVMSNDAGFGNFINDESNSKGYFTQRKKMIDLEKADGVRERFRFYWVGNAGEFPPTQKVWHSYVNNRSFRCKNVKKRLRSESPPPSSSTNLQPEDSWDTKAAANLKLNPDIVNPWFSSEYKKLFGVREGEDVGAAIAFMLEILHEGMLKHFEKCVLDWESNDTTPISDFAQSRVNQKCVYLTVLLCKVLEKYSNPVGMKLSDLCDETIKYLATIPSGVPPLKNSTVLQRWFADFRDNGRRLVVPAVSMAKLKDARLPPFLIAYPELKEAIEDFADANI